MSLFLFLTTLALAQDAPLTEAEEPTTRPTSESAIDRSLAGGPPAWPVSARDINGDGTLERVLEEDCGMRIVDEDGTVFAVAGATCCGC